jgi:hypothetical protein
MNKVLAHGTTTHGRVIHSMMVHGISTRHVVLAHDNLALGARQSCYPNDMASLTQLASSAEELF